jgi:hypothetical protein
MNNSIINISRLILLLGILSFTGFCCTRYYKPVQVNTDSKEASSNVIAANAPNKYFIIHQGINTYSLNNITVDNIAMTMNGTLSEVDDSHLQYIKAKGNKYRYIQKNEGDVKNVLNEVHIYTKNTSPLDITKAFSLPLDQIEKIEVIEHDKSRTTTSYVLGGVGITLGVIAVAAVIVALTKESCPFVSTYDGEQYSVQGELFGGAVNPKLERPDYLPLKTGPLNGEFQLRISNELKEKQYTNYADLVVIEHNSNLQAGIATDGKVYMISDPQPPSSAYLNNNRDILQKIIKADGASCNFDDTLAATSTNELLLTFQPTGKTKNAKLVMQLKNTYWLDYLFGEFTRNFGSSYEKWQKKQSRQSAENMIQWISEQHIPLTFSVSTDTGWKEIMKLNTIGPLINRQVIIPFDIPGNINDVIKIKLSTGFMFWELDYAALDLSSGSPYTSTTIKPYYAIDEKGNDVLYQLIENDEKYVSQLETGNYVTLKYKFDKPVTPGRSYSVVLETKGYYVPIRAYSGKPNINFIKKFKEPGALSAFSKDKYRSIIKNQSIIALNSK